MVKCVILQTLQQKRRIDMITIGNPDIIDKQRVVIILARIHPGESPSSFVCQGTYYCVYNLYLFCNLFKKVHTHEIFQT